MSKLFEFDRIWTLFLCFKSSRNYNPFLNWRDDGKQGICQIRAKLDIGGLRDPSSFYWDPLRQKIVPLH